MVLVGRVSSLLIYAGWLVVVAVLGWVAIRTGWAFALPAAVRRAGDRYLAAVRRRTGRVSWLAGPVAALGVVVGALAAIMLLMWGLGRTIAHAQSTVDVPVFHYFSDPRHRMHWFTSINLVVTQIGNRHPTEAVAILGAIGFAIVRTSRRWVPFVTFPVAYVTEKYPQHWLALLVDRGHPPTAPGTWPSGGCARAFLVFGLVGYFLLHRLGPTRRGTRVAVWSAVTLIEVTEAFTRVYLLKHWCTDVLPGGILFGALLLATWTTAAVLMDRDRAVSDGDGQTAAVRRHRSTSRRSPR